MSDKNFNLGCPRAFIFDLMGTCLDWHSSITPTLKEAASETAKVQGRSLPSSETISELALHWRQTFFDEIHARFEVKEPPEDIDVTHERVFRRLLSQPRWNEFAGMTEEGIGRCVAAWHYQKAWPDAAAALPLLRQRSDVVVLANGTARLQIDITKSSCLKFDMLLSSELLGITKPDPKMYERALELLKCKPTESVMVAAHAYDLRAAKRIGMRTVYLRRWTEDLQEDMDAIRAENDLFIDSGEATSSSGGLVRLAELIQAGVEVPISH